MEEQTLGGPNLEATLMVGERGPQIVQVVSIREYLTESAPQQIKEEPDEGLPELWAAQWQESPKATQKQPQLPWPKSEGDDKESEALLETAADIGQGPGGKSVARSSADLCGSQTAYKKPATFVKVKEEIIDEESMANMEAWRQRFRQFSYQEANGPREVFHDLWELGHQWLRPKRHTKEQIVEVLILEQFLSILPPEMQHWVTERGPKTCMHAVALAEDFLRMLEGTEKLEVKMPRPLENIEAAKSLEAEQDPSITVKMQFPMGEKQKNGKMKSFLGDGQMRQNQEETSQQERPEQVELHEKLLQNIKGNAFPFPDQKEVPGNQQEPEKDQENHTAEGNTHLCKHSSRNGVHRILMLENQRTKTLHTCSFCGRTSKSLSRLIMQERIHTEEKPYSCSECGKCFSRKVSLIAHKRIHTGLAADSKRPHKAAEVVVGMSPVQVPETGAGTGQGPATEFPPPPAVEIQQWVEEQHEASFGVDLGDMSIPATKVTSGAQMMLEEQQGETSLVSADASIRPFRERQEEKMMEREEEAEEKEEETEEMPPTSQPLCPWLFFSAPRRHGVSALSASREAAPGVPAAPGRRGCPYTSDVWKHFQRMEDPRYAQCQHCRVRVSRGKDLNHLSTTSLRNHLKKHHQPVLLLGKKPAGATCPPASQQRGHPTTTSVAPLLRSVGKGCQESPTEGFGGGGTSVPRGGIQRATKRVTRKIAEMIAIDGHPFTLVQDVGFRRLLQEVCPWYTPPACTTLSRTVVPSLYRAAKEHVQAQMSRAAGRTLHFTSDLWTSPQSQQAYLSLTAHWWQPDDPLCGGGLTSIKQGHMGDRRAGYCKALLHAEVLDETYPADSIAATIERQLLEWVDRNIAMGYMVTSGGSNIKAAAMQVGLEHIDCIGHKLHLVVKDALGLGSSEERGAEAVPLEFQRLLQRCQHLADHFSHSVKASRQLRQKQVLTGVPEHHIITDVVTRWNATHAMLERLVEQQAALTLWLSENDAWSGEGEFSQEDWLTISQVMEVLKPFKDFTVTLSSDSATLGLVIPLVKSLQTRMASFLDPEAGHADLAPAVRALVERLQQGIASQLEPLTEKELYMLATLCDPRIKGTIAERAGNLTSLSKELSRRVQRRQARKGSQPTEGAGRGTGSPPPEEAPPVASPGMSLEMKLLQCALGPFGNVRRMSQDSAEAIVRDYLAEPCELLSTDPLSYWAKKEAVWPDLALEAQKLLSCPPTSVQSECVFPHLVSLPRPPLFPWSLEQSVFLKVNLLLFDYPTLDFQSE